ncbi:MAG: hypothetical protein EBY22_15440, partial [Gammaproteobacteria bacterium]|nr:hypothetical protein [Gammaproteobacteria bacterium]
MGMTFCLLLALQVISAEASPYGGGLASSGSLSVEMSASEGKRTRLETPRDGRSLVQSALEIAALGGVPPSFSHFTNQFKAVCEHVTLYDLTKHAKNKLKNLNKLGHVKPDIVSQAILANDLAINAKEMSNSLDSFDPASTSWTMDVDRYENMVKQDIAQASAIFHDIDKYEYMHNLSKNKAGKIIKRR